MKQHSVTSKTLGDYASYGALTGKRIRGLKTGIEYKVTGLQDTPTGLVLTVERLNMTPLEKTGCQVTTIPWLCRDNYAVMDDPDKPPVNPIPTYMLRHHLQAIQNSIEQDVYYAEVLRTRARNERKSGDTMTSDATLVESQNYEECADRMRCAIACLLDTKE